MATLLGTKTSVEWHLDLYEVVDKTMKPSKTLALPVGRLSTVKEIVERVLKHNRNGALACRAYWVPTATRKEELAFCQLLSEKGIPVEQRRLEVVPYGELPTSSLSTTGILPAGQSKPMSSESSPSLGSSRSSSKSLLSSDDDDDTVHLPWRASSPSAASSSSSTGVSGVERPSRHGLCGLYNLGNTCFMNSALQCLSNTPLLRKFFLSGAYVKELNRTNPIGTKGELATEFARLVQALWSGRSGAVTPRDFKWTLGQYAHQFSGYQQQDSQELMGFLLDGMHEDLNRVIHKPIVEAVETSGKDDGTAASESWSAFKKRNDSIIVDTFMGQLRNTVVCPDCHTVSVTFDPMMFLSLPLPSESKVNIKFQFVSRDLLKPRVRFCFEMKMTDAVSAVKRKLVERISGLSADKLLVVDVFQCKVHRQLKDTELVTQIGTGDDIFVYEVADDVTLTDKEWIGIEYVLVRFPSGLPIDCIPPLILRTGKRGVISQREVFQTAREILSAFLECEANEKVSIQLATHEFDGEKAVLKETDDPVPSLRGRVFFEWEKPRDQKLLRAFVSSDSLAACTQRSLGEVVDDSSVTEKELRLRAKITLGDCLGLFTTEERLNEENMWYCPKCKEHKMATKKMEVFTLPRVLIVHLKRFRSQRFFSREKIERPIIIPDGVIDLTPYMAPTSPRQPSKYRVFAVSNHFGGLGGGHYIAHAINSDTGRWHQFDDSYVSAADGQTACEASSAYVLFMERIDEEEKVAAVSAIGSSSSSSASSADAPMVQSRETADGAS